MLRIYNLLQDTAKFCANFFDASALSLKERQDWTKNFVLQLTDEAHEVLREVNWKHHVKRQKPVIKDQLLIEMIDALKFWSCLAHTWEFTEADIAEAYFEKTKIVEGKYAIANKPAPRGPKIIVDIDDVLAEFKQGYYAFLAQKYGLNVDVNSSFYYFEPGLDLKGLNTNELFNEFIVESRGFKQLQDVDCAVAGLKTLVDAFDFHVTLLTARPQLSIVEHDTLFWLFDNDIPFNELVFAEDKETYKGVKDALFVVEDRWRHARAYAQAGKKVLLLDKPYNKPTADEAGQAWCVDNIIRCPSWTEIVTAGAAIFHERI